MLPEHELERQFTMAEQDLWDYTLLRARIDAGQTQASSGGIVWWRPQGGETSSPQERHVIKWEDALNTLAAVDRLLRLLNPDHRQLVRLRYFERRQWDDVACRLHVSEATAFRWRQEVLSRYVKMRGA